jgi:predicted NACHT family NTPase
MEDFILDLFVNYFERKSLKAIESAGSSAEKKTDNVIDRFWDKKEFKDNVSNYVIKLRNTVGQIKILGMSKPVELRDLYVNVLFLEQLTKKQMSTTDNLEYLMSQHASDLDNKSRCYPGLKAVEENDFVTVLGKPGAGKTTFLKYIALTCTGKKSKINKIPIFIPLNEFSESNLKLQDYINNIFRDSGFKSTSELINTLQSDGQFIFLLDGLDEVPETRSKEVINEIKKYTFKNNKCKYVISCRSAAYNYLFTDFVDVEIADFNNEQENAFIEKFFNDQPTKKKECLNSLSDSDNIAIRRLCSSPLLLTLLCIAFDDGMEFPTSRVELYEDAIETLLKRWDTTRQIKRDVVYRELTYKKKKKLLQELAYSTYTSKKYFFKKREAIGLISSFVDRLGTGIDNLELDSEVILKSIEAQHGLITERAYNIYSFSHLTFQEYFTAAYICQNTNFDGRNKLIDNHIRDSRYREVFLLVVGLLDQADDFLLAIRDKVSSLATGNLLFSVINKTNSLIDENVNYPIPIKRAIALSAILNSININSHKNIKSISSVFRTASVLSDSLLERCCEIYCKYFNEDLKIAELKTIKFGEASTRDSVDELLLLITSLNPSELTAFVYYIQASKLLMDCMAIDCVANKTTKMEIIESFLIETF